MGKKTCYFSGMQHTGLRRYLNLALVLAIALMGVSPACAFISGKTSLIEICTTDGLKSIAVPAEQAPAAPEHGDHHKSQPPCLFCFAVAKTKANVALSTFPSPAPVLRKPAFAAAAPVFIPRRAALSFQPRGPPFVSFA